MLENPLLHVRLSLAGDIAGNFEDMLNIFVIPCE